MLYLWHPAFLWALWALQRGPLFSLRSLQSSSLHRWSSAWALWSPWGSSARSPRVPASRSSGFRQAHSSSFIQLHTSQSILWASWNIFALSLIYSRMTNSSQGKFNFEIPYPLERKPGVLFFVTGFLVEFNSNFELWMTKYWVPGEHRQILNIDRLNTNMKNTKFKGACLLPLVILTLKYVNSDFR